DLVEDCSIAELQELVKKAIQEATNPLKREIQTLKATIERLSGRIQDLNREKNVQPRTSPQTTTPNTPERSLPNNATEELTQEEAINHLSWAQVAASPGQARAATPSSRQWQVVSRNKTGNLKPPKRVADGDRRLIIQKPNGMEARHGPELVVALNATLQKSGAAAHIRVQRVDINAKGTASVRLGPYATGTMALKYKKELLQAACRVDESIADIWEERNHGMRRTFQKRESKLGMPAIDAE
ncbi:hypothetical protein EX30DRAFT_375766, partial [Ascodesmis nigricans]